MNKTKIEDNILHQLALRNLHSSDFEVQMEWDKLTHQMEIKVLAVFSQFSIPFLKENHIKTQIEEKFVPVLDRFVPNPLARMLRRLKSAELK